MDSLESIPWYVGAIMAIAGSCISAFAPSVVPIKYHMPIFILGVVLGTIGIILALIHFPVIHQLAVQGWPMRLTLAFLAITIFFGIWWAITAKYSLEEFVVEINAIQDGLLDINHPLGAYDGQNIRLPFPTLIIPMVVNNTSDNQKTIYPILKIENLDRWYEAMKSSDSTAIIGNNLRNVYQGENNVIGLFPPLKLDPKTSKRGRFIFMIPYEDYDKIFPDGESFDEDDIKAFLTFHDFFTTKQISEPIYLSKYV
ncbi:MAG: hypothetical protein IIB73_03460 [Proteobacteria bacterium]|nr:hypothetical protein [Pseudomonadota bacterium]